MRWLCSALALAAGLVVSPNGAAAETTDTGGGATDSAPTEGYPPSVGRVAAVLRTHAAYDLERCLDLAAHNYPRIQEARAKVAKSRAERWQARVTPYSQAKLTSGLGLVPSLHGNGIYSPNTDVALSSSMSLLWQASVEWAIPLWTFGKLENLWEAADAQVTVGEHEVRKAKNEVLLNVRRAYYGAQLARDSLLLVRAAQRSIASLTKDLEQQLASGEGDEIQVLKLKMYAAELEAKESEARKQESIALSGLRFLTGVRGEFRIPDEPLEPVRHSLGPLSRYLAAARLYRPEINMARAGVVARKAQVELERARYFPDLALGARWKWGRAPELSDQRNPFVRDEANVHSYGAALVLEWKLDFLPTAARVAAAEAELEKMRATERFALGGVGAEVEEAYAEAEDAGRRLSAYSRATRYAKEWLIKVQQGIDIGLGDDEDLIEPSKEYALKRFSRMAATFDYNVALSKLALATGWDAVAPRE